jgi:hypothetical protein
MKKRTKCVLFGFLGLLSLTLGMMTLFVYFLSTPSGSQLILSQIQKSVQEKKGKFEYKHGQIRPFSRIHFEGLRFVQVVNNHSIELNVSSIDIRYRLSILSRIIEVEKFQWINPSLLVKPFGSGGTEEKKKPPAQSKTVSTESIASSTGDSLKELSRWLISPWVQVLIHELAVDQFNLDMDYRNPDFRLLARVQNSNIRLDLTSVPKKLTSSGTLDIGDLSSVTFFTSQESAKTELQLFPVASAKWTAGVRFEDSQWFYEVKSSQLRMGFKKLNLAQVHSHGSTQVKWENLNSDSEAHILAKSAELFRLDSKSIEKLECYQSLQSGSLEVRSDLDGKKDVIRIPSQTLTFNSHFTDVLKSRFDYQIQSFFSQKMSLKPAHFGIHADSEVSADLSNMKINGTGDVNSIPLLNLNLQGKWGEEISSQGKISLFLKTRLTEVFRSAQFLFQTGSMHGDMDVSVHQKEKDKKQEVEGTLAARWEQDEKRGIRLKFDPVLLNLQAKTRWDNKEKKLKIESLTHVKNHEWGDWSVKTESDALIRFPENQSASLLEDGVVEGSLLLSVTQEKVSTQKPYDFILEKPVLIENQIHLNKGKTKISLKGLIPVLNWVQTAKIFDTQLTASLESPQLTSSRDLEFAIDLKQGKVIPFLDEKVSKNVKPLELSGLNLNLKAGVQSDDRFVLKEFGAHFNHSMVQMTAEATGNAKTRNYQSKGVLKIQIPEDFPEVLEQVVRGEVEVPWRLSLLNGKDGHFEGEIKIHKFDWKKAPWKVSGIQGRVPISEDFQLDGNGVRFSYQIRQNPFERVDYERVQPMIHKIDRILIEKIGFEDKAYGPFQGYFSMSQNMVFAHKFDFNLMSGRSSGEMYLNLHPDHLQLDILSRLTGLNLKEVLPQKYLAKSTENDGNLSGRVGVVINLNRSVVDGRVDITEIGRDQLITMMYMIDPQYSNEQLNRARFALGIAYPSMVGMYFQKGYLDMFVKLGGVTTQEFYLRGIPVASQVSSKTADLIKKSKEIPLK